MRLLFLALLALAACADAPDPAEVPDAVVEAGAPATAELAAGGALGVGDRAPDFQLPGVDGATVRLSDLLIDGPVVLTFYRGAWCPYCNTQLRDYQQALARVEAAGAQLVAVSPQAPDSSTALADRAALAFPVLSDLGNAVSRAYGLVYRVDDATRRRYESVGVDLDRYNGTDDWELPVPATYVVRRDGTIAAAFVEADYTQRASARMVLDALDALG
ncbi:peroxiredoxin-like family protein [Rubrivirga sp. IMCC43871]|uniref:peroxiredoxin-like family protein n=1 Tax=Rubrivirga sp. IMCC43871 TaxID=3391575 RepID=UPI003990338F